MSQLQYFPEITRDEVFMIGTKRLWLRWPRAEDAARLAAIGGDRRVATRTGTWPVGADAAFALGKIEAQRACNTAGTGFGFVIARRQSWAEPIGMLGFNAAPGEVPTAAGGYHLDPGHWGLGLMSEALGGMIEMIRLLTPVAVLRASVMPDNPASANVLRKSGFARTGVGLLTTAPRGTFPVEHYERVLRPALREPASEEPEATPRPFARVYGPPRRAQTAAPLVAARRSLDV